MSKQYLCMSPSAANDYREQMAARGVHISECGKTIARDYDALKTKQEA